MRNITITVDDELARSVRIWAAKQNKSISAAVASLLESAVREDERYEAAMRSALSVPPRDLGSDGKLPLRNRIYDR
jgi:plasmid stability protein